MDVRDRACLMPGKNMSSSLGGPHRIPGPHPSGARNSILSIVKYQILFLLLKGKCTHEDLLITLTHMCFSHPFILDASPLPLPFQMWAMCLDCGFLKSAQQDRLSPKKWHYAPLGAPLTSDWVFKKSCFLWAILHWLEGCPQGNSTSWTPSCSWFDVAHSLDAFPLTLNSHLPTGFSFSQRTVRP